MSTFVTLEYSKVFVLVLYLGGGGFNTIKVCNMQALGAITASAGVGTRIVTGHCQWSFWSSFQGIIHFDVVLHNSWTG